MNRYLSAELLRSRASALQWLPQTAVPLVLLTYVLATAVDPRKDAVGVLMWQAIYLTGMAAPLAALFAAAAENREKRAGYGGALWMPVSRRRVRGARFAVVVLSLAVFHILNFGGTWLVTALAGRPGGERILQLGLYAFVGAIGVAGLSSAVARVTNLITALGAAVAWQMIGIVKPVVEGAHWWLWPMAWPVRLVLPVLGVHQNAVPLEPDSPLNGEAPGRAIVLCLILAAVGAAAAVFAGENVRITRRGRDHVVSPVISVAPGYVPPVARRTGPGAPHPFSALTRAALTPALVTCLGLTAAGFVLTAVVYPPSYTHGLFAFAVLPLGAGLLPVLLWPPLEQAWAVIRIEHGGIARVLLLWCGACVVGVSIAAAAAGLIAGGGWWDEARRILLGGIVGYVIVLVVFQLVRRIGISGAVIAIVIVTVFSVALGGDVLAETPLWVLAFPSWPDTAVGAPRFVTALTVGCVLVAALQRPTERLLNR